MACYTSHIYEPRTQDIFRLANVGRASAARGCGQPYVVRSGSPAIQPGFDRPWLAVARAHGQCACSPRWRPCQPSGRFPGRCRSGRLQGRQKASLHLQRLFRILPGCCRATLHSSRCSGLRWLRRSRRCACGLRRRLHPGRPPAPSPALIRLIVTRADPLSSSAVIALEHSRVSTHALLLILRIVHDFQAFGCRYWRRAGTADVRARPAIPSAARPCGPRSGSTTDRVRVGHYQSFACTAGRPSDA